jgi:hypothetical protein
MTWACRQIGSRFERSNHLQLAECGGRPLSHPERQELLNITDICY